MFFTRDMCLMQFRCIRRSEISMQNRHVWHDLKTCIDYDRNLKTWFIYRHLILHLYLGIWDLVLNPILANIKNKPAEKQINKTNNNNKNKPFKSLRNNKKPEIVWINFNKHKLFSINTVKITNFCCYIFLWLQLQSLNKILSCENHKKTFKVSWNQHNFPLIV